MNEYESHVVSDIRYHFVWHTADKVSVLDKGIKERLKELLQQDCKSKKITILGGNIGSDHVHMILSCPARLAPSTIMQELKGRASYNLQHEFPQLRDVLPGKSLWVRGYYCATFGEVTDEDINGYIGRGDTGFQPLL